MPNQLVIKEKIEKGRLLKVAPFRKDIRKTIAHKHNSYFEIIFLTAGTGFHFTDSIANAIQPPCLFFVRKEQVHHWDIESDPDGFVLIIKKEYIDNSPDTELKKLIGQVSSFTALYPAEAKTIDTLFHLLVAELKPEADNNNPVMEGMLKGLLGKIIESGDSANLTKKGRSGLFGLFNDQLQSGSNVRNNVAYYASLLHTTPQNLNAACRKAIGISASELLSEFIISEAKRLLVYTEQTISEIALQLDFKDNSHFVKYFKRFTGLTPKNFRNLN